MKRWESWIDRAIREAQERGEFDDLPGLGKPIPDHGKPHDELWWVKQLLRREKLSLAPATLELKRDVERAVGRIRAATSEKTVRRIVEEINGKIAAANAKASSGPPSDLAPLDPDAVVERWRKKNAC